MLREVCWRQDGNLPTVNETTTFLKCVSALFWWWIYAGSSKSISLRNTEQDSTMQIMTNHFHSVIVWVRASATFQQLPNRNMAAVSVSEEKGMILIMWRFKIIMQPTHELVLLSVCRPGPTEALVRWYCSVSGVGSRLYFQIQNQINFLFSKPWRNSARRQENPKFREKIQLFFFGSRLQVCLSKKKPTVI